MIMHKQGQYKAGVEVKLAFTQQSIPFLPSTLNMNISKKRDLEPQQGSNQSTFI